jgi:hypothetical protein
MQECFHIGFTEGSLAEWVNKKKLKNAVFVEDLRGSVSCFWWRWVLVQALEESMTDGQEIDKHLFGEVHSDGPPASSLATVQYQLIGREQYSGGPDHTVPDRDYAWRQLYCIGVRAVQ